MLPGQFSANHPQAIDFTMFSVWHTGCNGPGRAARLGERTARPTDHRLGGRRTRRARGACDGECRPHWPVAPDRRLSLVQDRMSWHDMSQGTVQQTGNPLDVAIDGEGMLVVQTAGGERYTRNGALQVNNVGELVTMSGDRVVGENGPIILQPTDRDIVII